MRLNFFDLGGVEERRFDEERFAQGDIERHDVGFTERIDRRIGHLSETLFAVIPQGTAGGGDECGRSVVAHAPNRFFAFQAERLEEHAVLIFAPAESGGDALGMFRKRAGKFNGGLDLARGTPAFACATNMQDFSDFIAAPDLAFGGVNDDHFAGAETHAGVDALVIKIGKPGFGAGHQQTVGGDGVTQRAQAVAVEFRADVATVAENESGGSVPGFLLARLCLQEELEAGAEVGIGVPGRRDEAEHGGGDAVIAAQVDFKSIVETGGIADAGFEKAAPFRRVHFPEN